MSVPHAGGTAVIPPKALFTLSFASLGSGLWAAAEFQQWPPIIIGVAGGTAAFLYGLKGMADDRVRRALSKQIDDMAAEHEKRELANEHRLDAAEKRTEEIRRDADRRAEELRADAEKKAEEIRADAEKKAAELKDKLAVAEDEIRNNRHNLRDLQNQVVLMKALAEAREKKGVGPIHADKVEIQSKDVKQV